MGRYTLGIGEDGSVADINDRQRYHGPRQVATCWAS